MFVRHSIVNLVYKYLKQLCQVPLCCHKVHRRRKKIYCTIDKWCVPLDNSILILTFKGLDHQKTFDIINRKLNSYPAVHRMESFEIKCYLHIFIIQCLHIKIWIYVTIKIQNHVRFGCILFSPFQSFWVNALKLILHHL